MNDFLCDHSHAGGVDGDSGRLTRARSQHQNLNCAYCSVRSIGLCGALGDGEGFHELRDFPPRHAAVGRRRANLSPGRPHGDIYNLVSGWVCLQQDLEDGRRQILRFILPGELFGHEPAGMTTMSHAAQALTNASTCVIPTRRVTELRAAYPDFSDRFVWMLERDSLLTMDHLTSLGRRNALERTAHLLLELAVRITPPLSVDRRRGHQDSA